MKKLFYILLFIGCIFFSFIAPALAGQSGRAQYEKATQLVKRGQYDFALLAFRSIIRDFPESKYAQEAKFALGEYFYRQKAYFEAIQNFTEYIKKYPDTTAAIFAKAYLIKIMESMEKPSQKEKELIDKIKMDFFSKPLFLLFSEHREVSYKSALANDFTIRYYIEDIEVYINDKPFIKITQ